MTGNVIKLIVNNSGEGGGEPWEDIPETMKRVAEDISKGEYGNCVKGVFVLVNDEGENTIFGWGKEMKGVPDAYYTLSVGRRDLLD